MGNLIEYLPIATTILAAYFTKVIYEHYKIRKTTYLFWWTIGVITFGLGTLAESINVTFGWSEANLKYWYITGALLGGFPLAQGSVYLLLNRKFANASSVILVLIIITASVFVILTPLTIPGNFHGKLTGSLFTWKWVRYFSPIINSYSFIFLVGGAIYSAYQYYKLPGRQAQFKGNIFIASGALLPGIGGTFTRIGYVKVLFVTELLGLLLIYTGYRIIKLNKKKVSMENKPSADK